MIIEIDESKIQKIIEERVKVALTHDREIIKDFLKDKLKILVSEGDFRQLVKEVIRELV